MKLHPVDLKKIHINDAFWSKHVALVKEAVIPYQWDAINDRIEAVSYTHLDVYKRQGCNRAQPCAGRDYKGCGCG